MANSYYDLSKLSKVQLPGGGTYRLQDNDLRQMAYTTAYASGQAYAKNKIVYVADEDALYIANSDITTSQNTGLEAFKALATEISLADALLSVYNQLSAIIAGGTHFIGRTTTALTDHATTNPITIDGNEVTAIQGDIVIYNNGTIDIEFIFDGTYWNEFGTAGLLKALAFADTASGSTTLNTVDSATFENGTASVSADYTPAGNITVAAFNQTETAATLTKGDYTPAGTITISGTGATIGVLDQNGNVTSGTAATFTQGTDTFTQGTDSFTANVPTALDLTKFSGGSKAADTFDAGSLPSKAADTFDAGALPSKAADTFNAGSLPSLTAAQTATFVNEGVVAAVDNECLVFTAAATATAVTAQGSFDAGTLPTFTEGAFSAGTLPSFTEGTFSAGALPSFTEGTFTAATLAEGFYTAGSAAQFTQGTDTFTQGEDDFTANTPTAVTLPTFKEVTVLSNATATFTGETAEDVLVTAVTYDKATSAGATFAGTAATITSTGTATGSVSLTSTAKTIAITVTPDTTE